MATTPSNAISVQAPVVRPVEAKPSRDPSAKTSDFGKELQREMNRDRTDQSTEKAESTPNTMPAAKDKVAQADKGAAKEGAKEDTAAVVNEQAAQPWLAMLQAAATPAAVVAPVVEGEQTLLAADDQAPVAGDLASLLAANISQSQTAARPDAASDQQKLGTAVELSASKALPAVTASSEALETAIVAADAAKTAALPLTADLDVKSFSEALNTQITPINEQRAANAALSTQPTVQKAAETPVHHLPTPVGDSRWGEAVAQRVGMMLGRQEQKIEMTLNPPHLGPMEVSLNMSQEQATVVFSSQNAAVREALAAATPRLTALLADQGIVLTNVQVASDSLQQHQQQANQQQAQSGFNQASQARDFGGGFGARYGAEVETRVELGEVRLPVGRGGVSLFV